MELEERPEDDLLTVYNAQPYNTEQYYIYINILCTNTQIVYPLNSPCAEGRALQSNLEHPPAQGGSSGLRWIAVLFFYLFEPGYQ